MSLIYSNRYSAGATYKCIWRYFVAVLALAVLAGCNRRNENIQYKAGEYKSSSTYAGECTAVAENFWLRSWTHELYLWYDEVPDLNPHSYADPVVNYFPLLKTSATTPSGKDKDRFHFTYKTSDWIALSQSGISAGYGAEFAILSNSPPRQVVVAYVDPNTPAATNQLTRGEQIINVDGADVVNGNNIDILNAGLFPTVLNQSHTFVLLELDGMTQRTVIMSSDSITSQPVQNAGVIAGTNGQVGYMLFNDHIATAEQELIDAFTALQTAQESANSTANANVFDLVLDLRYNGGGYLDMASEVAYMIAGDTQTSGKTFEQAVFNSQYSANTNPVTHASNNPTLFHSTAQGFSTTAGTALPTLSLNRVFVLTGSGTCSASEAIINSLRGINVQVIQIGSTTCGKPYGFYPQDNCGITYFSIEVKGANDMGFGDYTDGFSPANSLTVNSGVSVPGCSVADDFTHQLGDPAEGRLAAALGYRANTTCPAGSPTGSSPHAQIQSVSDKVDLSHADGVIFKNPLRENRIMRR